MDLLKANGSSKLAQLAVAGAAGSLLSTLLFTFLSRPERMFQLAEQWGPWATLVFFGLYIFDRRVAQGVGLMRESAVATARVADGQQRLADAVQSLAQQNLVRQKDTEMVLDALAENSRATLSELHRLAGEVEQLKERIQIP